MTFPDTPGPFEPPPHLEDGLRRTLTGAAHRLPDPPGTRLPALGGATEPPAPAAVDPAEFDDFYAAHRPPVYRALALALDDRDLATEAVDRGFSAAYRRWRKDRGSAPDVFAAARAWAVRHAGGNGGTRGFRLDRHAPTDAAAVAAFRDLDEPDRAALVVRHLLGWDGAAAAAALDLPPADAAAHLDAAHRLLGEALGTGADDAARRLALALPAEAAAQTVPLSRVDRAKGAVWTRRLAAAGAAAAAVLVLIGGVGLGMKVLSGGDDPAASSSTGTGATGPITSAAGPGDTTELEWNRIPLGPEQGDISTVGYGPGGFVVMGQTYDARGSRMVAFVSEDGEQWEAVQLPELGVNGGWIAQVIGSDDGYAALGSAFDERSGSDSTVVWTSPDGLTWTTQTLPAEQQGEVAGTTVRFYTYASTMARTGDGYIVFGNRGADIGDPEQLLRGSLPDDVSLNFGWGWDGTRIDVYGSNGEVVFQATAEELGIDPDIAALMSGGLPIAWRSNAEGEWEQIELGDWIGPTNYLGRVASTAAGLVAVVHQQFGAQLWFSEDGVEWARVEMERGATVTDAGAVGDTFVAIGSVPGTGAAWTSTDGTTWTRVNDPALSAGYFQQVTSGPYGVAAVASGQGVLQADLPPAVVVQDGFTITVDATGFVTVTDDTGAVVAERFADEVAYGTDGSLTITDDEGEVIVMVSGSAMNRAWEEVYSSQVVVEGPFQGGNTEQFRLLLSADGKAWTTVDLTESIGPGFYPNQVAVGPDAVVLSGWQESFRDFEGPNRPSVWVGRKPSS